MKIKEKIIDTINNTEEIIERDITKDEVIMFEQNIELNKQLTAQAAAKAALLERLGITEEEAKLLLG